MIRGIRKKVLRSIRNDGRTKENQEGSVEEESVEKLCKGKRE